MIRNFELIRKIIFTIAEAPAGGSSYPITFPNEYEEKVVLGHLELLIDAGLIAGKVLRSSSGIDAVMVRDLTWDGQDFYQAATKDTLWKKAFLIVQEKGGAMTFDVLKELLKRLAASAVDLP